MLEEHDMKRIVGKPDEDSDIANRTFIVKEECVDYYVIDVDGREHTYFKRRFRVQHPTIKIHLVSKGFLEEYEGGANVTLFADLKDLTSNMVDYDRVLKHWLKWLNEDINI